MKNLFKFLFLACLFVTTVNVADAQKKRSATKRTSTRKNAKTKTKTKFQSTAAQVDSSAAVASAPVTPPAPVNDSLPIAKVKKSLRPDEAVETKDIRDRIPLAYEHIRVDDAVYRQRVWRQIDAREKINLPFMYSADENNGNQRFISILLQAIQDSAVTVFDAIDDRFTTPLAKAEVAKLLGGGTDSVPHYNDSGIVDKYIVKAREINLDSFYQFKIKEEVIFDKESSRLYWRILGIAPVRNIYNSIGDYIGPTDIFWVYYPDLRPVLAKYDTYNGKNYGGRMSWEELFENRMFSGRIIKSSIDNPYDLPLSQEPGLKGNTLFQLLQGEKIKDQIFNYEQDLWSY